ncbi:polysaccharide deacetylase family protein [Nitrosospira multiformis]|uniref:polysaccharide deacetylase family protein n=1 Tax=Nitrosospira multiformis TaxID=1231 RepID=UPI00089B612D|nr:polysaccharide deacetylase family protein [Nitrosospira multiformis]SDZ76944.1 Peptidoglycan/xylan/chitin deacetylase, PgdA/CDA1 family [Nitrosospira multiformis]
MRTSEYDHVDNLVNQVPLWPLLTSRAMLHLLSPGGRHARLSILIYHRVLPCQDPLFPEESHARSFDQQMEQLAACFRVISLGEAIRGLRNGTLPPRAACVTFDDGYADNAEIALPILKKRGIPATFFVATGFLDGGRMFNDTVIELIRGAPGSTVDLDSLGLGRFPIGTVSERRQTIHQLLGKLKYLPSALRQSTVEAMSASIPVMLPDNLMMTSEQVRMMHNAGMEIGGHTASHPILAKMESRAACADIATGKEMLEGIIRAPVRFFAYPNGKPGRDYLPDHVRMVKKLGFDAAVSTAHGAARKGSDLHQLPRFTPWDRRPLRFALLMARNMLKTGETV